MEGFNDIIKGETLTLVDFYATWCGPCKTMHPVLEQLKADMGEKVRIVKIDIDKNRELTQAYNVQSVPTLMTFKSGEMLWRQSGAMPLGSLKEIINSKL